ncbi:unnamed protein product [Rotaria sp. Silwood1]|nr:unnamed protein product [Rotaria sp. Silwood1]CAF1471725.1 unnamed protein product [Rotaria sp. Silwood1]CAF4555459.1 unnamed protein product [Rotaria sp. Silwood1]CAF4705309.1 unnamed protein product [Rotaria sp. Silwood1]
MLEFFFFLILFYQTTLALLYNEPCTKKCNLPGMICINNICKCDSKNRRFWTGARCSHCPNDWTMTETACLTYYTTKMSWQAAEATCRNVKAELISFRDKSIIPLIFNASIKNQHMGISTLSAWTSARAINVSGLGVYKWLDKSIAPFNSKSDWWCKKTTLNLGYPYHYDEPTRLISPTKEIESCVNYWRGQSNIQVVCLDDQLCSRDYPFVSESSENKYIGPPPVISDQSDGTVPNDQSSGSTDNGVNLNNVVSTTAQPKKKSSIIIIIAVIAVLVLLAALVGGVFCFLKSRHSTRSPQKSLAIDSNIKEESINSDINVNDNDLNLNNPPPPVNRDLNMGVKQQQQQKHTRGGYSKQQFDEFE